MSATGFSATFAQQRLWLLQTMDPMGTAHHLVEVFRVRGPLDEAALADAVAELFARHDSLRTHFAEADGAVVQYIDKAVDLDVALYWQSSELEAEFAAGGEQAVDRFVQQLAAEPFDLQIAPLFRVRLGRLAALDHVLVFVTHHTVCDGWSIRQLLTELAAGYRRRLDGEPNPAWDRQPQYVDYAARELERRDRGQFDDDLKYWAGQLAKAPTLLELPAERPRSRAAFPAADTVDFAVPAPVLARLRVLCGSSRSTLFMVLLAGFEALLGRLSGTADLLVGVPLSGRTQPDTERIVGMFVNTVVLRADLSDDPSFIELVARTRKTVLDGQDHGELPFQRLVEHLNPDRIPGVNPLVQVMFQLLEGEFFSGLPLAGAEVTPVPSRQSTTTFDLSLDMVADDRGLRGSLNYSKDLFDREQVTGFAEAFLTLLAAAAQDPTRRVQALPLLSAAAEREVLDSLGRGPVVPVPQGATVLSFLQQQVAASAELCALSDGTRQWTFDELGRDIDALAAELVQRGVAAGQPVGLMVGRSGKLPLGMLGIMRAGAVFVPLDTQQPPERLRTMITQAQVRFLVTESAVAPECRELVADRLLVDEVPPGPALVERALPTPDDPAYLIFTSGSTGAPKGVLVQHGSLANLFVSHRQGHYRDAARAKPGGRLRVAHTMSISFDASWDQLLWMVDGHHLLVVDEQTRRNSFELLDYVRRERIDVLEATPSQLEQLVDLGLLEGGWVPGCVVLGGEAVRPSLWGRLGASGVSAVNMYGPTEFTVDALGAVVRGGAPVVGRAVANCRVLVLDGFGRVVPPGVTGELYLGGPQLAVGYVGAPGLTAERFVPDPFGPAGSRLYRTGDLGRFTVSGEVEFRGRVDEQVKIRGYRVEPGEVESVLLGRPEVRDAAVVVRPDQHGQPRLTAYVVTSEPVSTGQLRGHLAGSLPDYLVPSSIVRLDEIPRSVAGKLFLNGLADLPESGTEDDFVAPHAGTEQMLAEIFAEVLGVAAVGRFDNFFHLGGHSLSAVQVISRLRTVVGESVSLRVLFEHPTVADLATVLGGAAADQTVIATQASRDSAVTSFAQQRLWFLQQAVPESTAYNMIESFVLRGNLHPVALAQAIEQMVARNEVLRTTYRASSELPLQHVEPAWLSEVGFVDLSELSRGEAQDQAAALVRRIGSQHYELAAGSVFEAAIAKLAAEEHLLVLGMHHIACDDWSLKLMLTEISALYTALAMGDTPRLPQPAVQYLDFANWERDPERASELAGQLDHWLGELAQVPMTLSLPTDRPRSADYTGECGVVRFTVPAETTQALADLSQQHRTTLFTTLLAAFQILLARWSGQQDFAIGVPVAGRRRTELEGVLGFFVNTLPIKARLHGDPTFGVLLDRVRETVLAAYDHQDLPFDRLVQAINPDRSSAGNPLVQVTCQLFEDGLASSLALPGVEVGAFDSGVVSSRFDLALDLLRTGDSLSAELEYDAQLFDHASIAQVAEWYAALLAEVGADPARPVSELPLWNDAAAAELLAETGHGVTVDVDPGYTVLDAFRGTVAAYPEQVALVVGEDRHTFAELDAAVALVAGRLAGAGVRRGDIVALRVDRSAALVVGALGIMAAGAAVLPVDLGFPAERVGLMYGQCEVKVVVTDEVGGDPAFRYGAAVVPVTGTGPSVAVPAAQSDDPAYVSFTSGSTGAPIGVVVSHEALANLLLAHAVPPHDRPAAAVGRLRVAHTASVAFDASWDQLLWLVEGHELHLVSDAVRNDAEALVGFCRHQRIDVLNVPPSFAEQLVDLGLLEGGWVPGCVVLGGEAVRPSLWGRLGASGVSAVNMYGPTEFTVDALGAVVRGGAPVVGRAVANCRVLVLDGFGRVVPPGVTGELYLGGPQLAVGYVGAPGLTAERFVPDPFGPAGSRLYRTGDLGRFTVSGEVEFRGRVDEQVKIRGYRVEPGEVESVLLGRPEVRDAAVVVRPDQHGQPRLTAYVVPAEQVELPTQSEAFVQSWQSVFEDAHRAVWTAIRDDDATAAIVGWNDSFTGAAIPVAEMTEWVETTVDRVLSLRPSRLLEIGAGTGLLLRPLCARGELARYDTSDFAQPAVELLQAEAASLTEEFAGLEMTVSRAEAVTPVPQPAGSYDTVVVNSVAQYFPSLMYLDRVIDNAVRLLAPVGHLFLGDVRNAALLDAFFSLRQRRRTGSAEDVLAEIAADGELSVDPRYFHGLLARHPAITAVEITPRRGSAVNEMTLFRYDAIIHIGCPEEDTQLAWETAPSIDAEQLAQRLATTKGAFGYRRVANARLAEALQARAGYALGAGLDGQAAAGVDPEKMCLLAEKFGWTARLSWGHGDSDGTLDISFLPPGAVSHYASADPTAIKRAADLGAGVRVLAPRMEQLLNEGLRTTLAGYLPDFMVPQEFVQVTSLPRSASGKVQVSRLPAPRTPARASAAARAGDADVIDMASTIGRVLGKRLGVGVLGREEDFFQMGGESLTAAMAVRDLRRVGIKLSIRDVFTGKTPARMAELVDRASGGSK